MSCISSRALSRLGFCTPRALTMVTLVSYSNSMCMLGTLGARPGFYWTPEASEQALWIEGLGECHEGVESVSPYTALVLLLGYRRDDSVDSPKAKAGPQSSPPLCFDPFDFERSLLLRGLDGDVDLGIGVLDVLLDPREVAVSRTLVTDVSLAKCPDEIDTRVLVGRPCQER